MEIIGRTINHKQRNSVKGKAMEKMIQKTQKDETLGEKSIKTNLKRIIEEKQKENLKIYSVRIPFENGDMKFPKHLIILKKDIDETKNTSTFYKLDYRGLKICSNKKCKLHEQTHFKNRGKMSCLACGSKLDPLTIRLSERKDLIASCRKDEIIDFLLRENYIDDRTNLLNRRMDDLRIIDDAVIIFESKNNEKTGISNNTIKVSLIYPIIMKYFEELLELKINKIKIIYNGEIMKGVNEFIEKQGDITNLGIFLESIDKWLFDNKCEGKFLKEIQCTWNGKEYDYEYLFSEKYENPTINIVKCNPDCVDEEDIVESSTPDERIKIYDELIEGKQ